MAITTTIPTNLNFPNRGILERDAFVNAQETAQDLLAGAYTTALNQFAVEANQLEQNVTELESSTVASAALATSAANYKGEWASTTNYLVGQSVSYNGGLYLAKTNNINQIPSNNTYWLLNSLQLPINSIDELKTVSNIASVNVLGYYTKGDGGGGTFYWDATSTETDNGGTIIQATGITTGRWKRAYSEKVGAKCFGAKGDGITDDTSFIQKALDVVKKVYLTTGTYKITSLQFKYDGSELFGDGEKNTILTSSLTTGSIIYNPNKTTTTRYYCNIRDVQIVSVTDSIIIDWQSFQFGMIKNIWIYGTNKTTQTGLFMGAVWTTTECTYNNIENLYIGAVAYGIRFGEGANTNSFKNIRVQPGINGYGYHLGFGLAGRVSNNVFISCHCEYPSNTVTGFVIGDSSEGTTIVGSRFESLNTAITISAGAKDTTINGCYFSSCTSNVANLSSTTIMTTNGKFTNNATLSSGYNLDLVAYEYPGAKTTFKHLNGGSHNYYNDGSAYLSNTLYGSTYSGGTNFGVGANGFALHHNGGLFAIGTSTGHNLLLGANGTTKLKVKPNGCLNFVPIAGDPLGGEIGDVYFNSTTGMLRKFNGTIWLDV